MIKQKYRDSNLKYFQGLSLIEVCIAIAILAIIMVSLSGIFNQGYRFLRKTRLNQQACFLAQEQMEIFMQENIFPSPGSHNSTETIGDFTRQVNFTYPADKGSDAATNATLAEINVTVSWQGQSGTQNFTLISLVSNLAH